MRLFQSTWYFYPQTIDFQRAYQLSFCRIPILLDINFCRIEITNWLFYIMSVWLFSVCLFDCKYIPTLYIFCTYMPHTTLLANVYRLDTTLNKDYSIIFFHTYLRDRTTAPGAILHTAASFIYTCGTGQQPQVPSFIRQQVSYVPAGQDNSPRCHLSYDSRFYTYLRDRTTAPCAILHTTASFIRLAPAPTIRTQMFLSQQKLQSWQLCRVAVPAPIEGDVVYCLRWAVTRRTPSLSCYICRHIVDDSAPGIAAET